MYDRAQKLHPGIEWSMKTNCHPQPSRQERLFPVTGCQAQGSSEMAPETTLQKHCTEEPWPALELKLPSALTADGESPTAQGG